MAKPHLEFTCDLDLDLIKRSPGFSLDIGTSVAKIVLRPKDGFSKGEPKEKKEGQTMGTLRLVSLPRNDTHHVAQYIREHCDLSDNVNQTLDVAVTGVGSQTFKTILEAELNVRLHVKTEFDCFVDAFIFTSKTLSPEQLFFPLSQEYLENGKKTATELVMMMGHMGKTKPHSLDEPIPTVAKRPEFPCILVTIGSALDLKLVEEDGTYQILDGNFFSGRALLSISSLLTGTSDFAEIIRMVESTDGRSVDAYTTDMMDEKVTDDIYNQMPVMRMFPFGKAVDNDKDTLKREDFVHSIMQSQCEIFAQMTHSAALLRKIKAVYFSGSLVTAERVRDWVTKNFWFRNLLRPVEDRVELQFLRHGSHLGAFGAFMEGATENKT